MKFVKFTAFFVVVLTFSLCTAQKQDKKQNDERLIKELSHAAKEQLLEIGIRWLWTKKMEDFTAKLPIIFKVGEEHNKMIETQAGHVWTNARASEIFSEKKYLQYAKHEFEFFRDVSGLPKMAVFINW